MISKSLIALAALSSLSAFAAESQVVVNTDSQIAEQGEVINTDLVLEGERWLGKANGYVCQDKTTVIARPASLEAFNVVFEGASTDFSLDNGLLKATFEEAGVACRYSAFIDADNTAFTLALKESRAYAVDGVGSCEGGKALLDGILASNDYLYYGHPHHLGVVVVDAEAALACGEGATGYAIDFVLSGRK